MALLIVIAFFSLAILIGCMLASSPKIWTILLLVILFVPFISFLPGFSWMCYVLYPLSVFNFILVFIGLAIIKGLGWSTFLLLPIGLYFVQHRFGSTNTYKVAALLVIAVLSGYHWNAPKVILSVIQYTRPALVSYGEKYIEEI